MRPYFTRFCSHQWQVMDSLGRLVAACPDQEFAYLITERLNHDETPYMHCLNQIEHLATREDANEDPAGALSQILDQVYTTLTEVL